MIRFVVAAFAVLSIAVGVGALMDMSKADQASDCVAGIAEQASNRIAAGSDVSATVAWEMREVTACTR